MRATVVLRSFGDCVEMFFPQDSSSSQCSRSAPYQELVRLIRGRHTGLWNPCLADFRRFDGGLSDSGCVRWARAADERIACDVMGTSCGCVCASLRERRLVSQTSLSVVVQWVSLGWGVHGETCTSCKRS